MRACIFLTYFLLVFFVIGCRVEARAAWWKPERVPGSARLSLESIRSIYLPAEPSARLEGAVEDLVACWPVALERVEGSSVPSKQVFVLQRDASVEGFSYRRDRTQVYLRASTDEGLANGLYAICRELLGARWYWSGDLGLEFVGEPVDTFPDRVWRERPAFVQRTLSPVNTDFGRRNGLNRVYSFNHNLARIFTQEVFEATPEVFAEIGGVRQAPKRSAKYDPQPDFTDPGAVDLAAQAARAHFEENPDANSFSLSINDNSLFDEGAETEAVVRGVVRGKASGWEGLKVGRYEGGKVEGLKVEGGRFGGLKVGRFDVVHPRLAQARYASGRRPRLHLTRPRQVEGPASFYCAEASRKPSGEVQYFRGLPNYTDLVFGFMNQVAKKVYEPTSKPSTRQGVSKRRRNLPLVAAYQRGAGTFPPSNLRTFAPSHLRTFPPSNPQPPYLTALAYYWTEQSPSFQIHPQVMPVLTSDRAQWHDPDYRAEDKALIQRWANSGAERIATWDYYFGAPYPYPRQFTQWIGESIRYLHESGVDVFFSQLPSIWGLDGPKAWLTAELLRDSEQDVEVLLGEYYENFFGPAAAPIREFYEIAEQTRNEREGTANWIKFYKDEAGIELFTPETLVRMRACLDLATEHAREWSSRSAAASGGTFDSERYLKRVRIVSEAFSYTESYAAYHRSRVRLVELAMTALRREGPEKEREGLVRALADYERTKASFDELKRSLAEHPMHRGFATFNRLMQTDPMPLLMAALGRSGLDLEALDLQEDGILLTTLRAWSADELELVHSGRNAKLEHSGTERRNFLGPELPVINGWEIQYRASEGLQVGAARGQGASGLRVENADIVSLAQTYPVIGERAYLLQIEASWQVSPDNRSRVQLNWKSISGEKLRVDLLLRLPNGNSNGPQPLQFLLSAPVNAYDLQVAVVTNRQYEGDFFEIERIRFGQLVPKR